MAMAILVYFIVSTTPTLLSRALRFMKLLKNNYQTISNPDEDCPELPWRRLLACGGVSDPS